ncbi:MAG TPA: hypothetical protein VGS80_27345, partial [Ktedonobacterales bacterium]|nr:hypothetical protein [Ktedonobacterales bacterium]
SLLLTMLTPVLLISGMVLWFTLYYAIYLDHCHLQNELGAFLMTLVPAVTAPGAWIVGIVDVLRRRAWGWLALVALPPLLGTLAYGFAGRSKRAEGQPGSTAPGSPLLAGATLALLSVLMALLADLAGLNPSYDSTPELFALFGACVALACGVPAGLAFVRSRPARAAVVLLLSALLATQLVAGTSFPIQDVRAPGWAASVVLRVFGIPASEPAGLWVTLGLVAALAGLELACAPSAPQRPPP